eukprot:COSAG06_NODE_1096_length_10720_cov_195.594521_8_plen_65_part_00
MLLPGTLKQMVDNMHLATDKYKQSGHIAARPIAPNELLTVLLRIVSGCLRPGNGMAAYFKPPSG